MKKSRTSLFRTLILFFVLLVTLFILVMAWFAPQNDATASGLSVKAKPGTGLEVSFTDDENSEWSSEISNDILKSYPLITSNGIVKNVTGTNFFLPTLNRSTGVPTLNIGGTSWGVKRDAVANKDYFETDLYFRSKEALNVSLMTDSVVTPKDASGNKSDFGDFSKDYIAGTARVGFYDTDETLKFIWAPNPNYELTDSGDYTEIEKKSSGGSTSANLPGDYNYTPKLYLHERFAKGGNTSATKQHYMMTYDGTTNKYYALIEVGALPDVDHMVAVSESDAENPSTILNQNSSDSNVVYTFQQGATVEVEFDGTYTADNVTWPKMYHKVDGITKQEFQNLGYNKFKVLIAYEPNNTLGGTLTDGVLDLTGASYEDGKLMVMDFAYENSSDPSLSGGGTGGIYDFGTSKYEIDTDKSLAITAVEGDNRYGLAVENDNIVTKKIGVSSDTNIPFVSSEFLFKAEKVNGNSYKIKSNSTGKYLAISGTSLVMSQTGTEFTLTVGANGPLLGYNGTYIGYASGEFGAVSDISTAIEIFQGNAYNFIDNGTTQEVYKCLEKGKNVETTLGRVSANVSAFPTTNPIVDDLSFIDGVSLVKLIQDGEYYKGHIKVRIWAEGTDDEAKTPLAFGTFNTLLKFIGSPVQSSNQGS